MSRREYPHHGETIATQRTVIDDGETRIIVERKVRVHNDDITNLIAAVRAQIN